jgi:hypothetical protein
VSAPRFVVVGHPNKGKSSIVATLAQDERIGIAPDPGTTTRANAYPFRVDDEVLFELIDTPGFQRSRAALRWMQERAATAADRPIVVAEFVATHRGTDTFPDEVELLGPIVAEVAEQGEAGRDNSAHDALPASGAGGGGGAAGVLYVVDGSKPFGPEYEAEMEVLRWTGAPSMALINPIGSAAYVEQWERALGQYFRIVRVFNAVTAEWDKRIELLRAFGQLREAWRTPLDRAVAALEQQRTQRRRACAAEIASLTLAALRARVEETITTGSDPAALRDTLRQRYEQHLRQLEQRSRERVEAEYRFERLERDEASLTADLGDLFDQRVQLRFGLGLLGEAVGVLTGGSVGVSAGAALGLKAGAAVDIATLGATLGIGSALGAAAGGLLGGAGGWFLGRPVSRWLTRSRAGEDLAEHEVALGAAKIKLGRRVARFGPSREPSLALIVLARALVHHRLVEQRTHARRDKLAVDQAVTLPVAADWSATQVTPLLKPVLRRPDDPDAAHEAASALTPRLLAVMQRESSVSGKPS